MICGWKNKPIWLPNWRQVISRQANFSRHQGAFSWNRLVQQICLWSLLPHIKPVWYEGAKLDSKSFVAQHMFSLVIVGADEGALHCSGCVLQEHAAGASSLVYTGLNMFLHLGILFSCGIVKTFCQTFHKDNLKRPNALRSFQWLTVNCDISLSASFVVKTLIIKTVSSTWIFKGRYNNTLSLDATIMASKKYPTISENVAIIFVTQYYAYYSDGISC